MSEEEPKRGFTGAWIPKEVWTHPELTWMERCLWAEIKNLDGDKGCWASNGYLAKMMGSTQSSIANMLSKLRRCGLVVEAGFDGRRRFMRAIYPSPPDDTGFTQQLSQGSPIREGRVNSTVNIDTSRDTSIEYNPNPSGQAEAGEQKEKKSLTQPKDAEVDVLYNLYPRKAGSKPTSLRSIHKALKVVSFDVLKERVETYAKYVGMWPKEERDFVPYPATWFNGHRWEEPEDEWKRRVPAATIRKIEEEEKAKECAAFDYDDFERVMDGYEGLSSSNFPSYWRDNPAEIYDEWMTEYRNRTEGKQ